MFLFPDLFFGFLALGLRRSLLLGGLLRTGAALRSAILGC
jgi:hypothetical protein